MLEELGLEELGLEELGLEELGLEDLGWKSLGWKRWGGHIYQPKVGLAMDDSTSTFNIRITYKPPSRFAASRCCASINASGEVEFMPELVDVGRVVRVVRES